MATTLPTPGPQQPLTDDEARLAAFQILGSDIEHTWTGNWHQTLQQTAARWAVPHPDTRTCWFCGSDDNPATASTCGFCNHHVADGPTPSAA